MANATPRDMRAGFNIFREHGGELSRDELNVLLFEAGYGPISDRSYNHYRRLLRTGVERYISINRFDVARASVPYENASAKARYRYEAEEEGVRVLFAHRNRLLEADMVTETIGETGAVLRLVDEEFLQGLSSLGPAPGDQVSMRFVETGRVVAGAIIDVDLESSPALIEVNFASLQGLDMLTGAEARPLRAASFRLVAADEDATTTDVAGRRVFQFFELVEGLRTVANAADKETSSGRYSEPSILDSLSIASSPVVTIDAVDFIINALALGGGSALLRASWQGVAKRKEWWSGSVDQATVPKVKAETVVAVHGARKVAAEADLAEIEVTRAQEEQRYRDVVRQRIAEHTGNQDVNPKLIDAFIDAEILPALRSLGEAGIVGIEQLDVDESPDGEVA